MHKRITPTTDNYMKMVWLLKHKDFKNTIKQLKNITVKSKNLLFTSLKLTIGDKYNTTGDIFLLERIFPTLFGAFEELSEEVETQIMKSSTTS